VDFESGQGSAAKAARLKRGFGSGSRMQLRQLGVGMRRTARHNSSVIRWCLTLFPTVACLVLLLRNALLMEGFTSGLEVGLSRPMQSDSAFFSEETFLHEYLTHDANKTRSDRQYMVWTRFSHHLWKLEADFLRASLKSRGIPLVSLPPPDRDAPPLCPLESSTSATTRGRTVYDVFFFVNEIDVLDIRLHELAPAVDYFVIIQCPISFQNRAIRVVDPFQLEVLADVRGKMRVFTCNPTEYPTEVRIAL
jgi:hypothetical protein